MFKDLTYVSPSSSWWVASSLARGFTACWVRGGKNSVTGCRRYIWKGAEKKQRDADVRLEYRIRLDGVKSFYKQNLTFSSLVLIDKLLLVKPKNLFDRYKSWPEHPQAPATHSPAPPHQKKKFSMSAMLLHLLRLKTFQCWQVVLVVISSTF